MIDLTTTDLEIGVDPHLKNIGWFEGKRIVLDEVTKDVYYEVCKRESFNFQDALFKERLKPLRILPKEEQVRVTEWLEGLKML